ncbi:MAG: hypothetical protein WC043_07135 [Pseudobdellovibrionaceae bacterium]
MFRISAVIWVMAAPTLMGILVMLVLIMPSLADKQALYISAAALVGALIAAPISYLIAKAIKNAIKESGSLR